MAASISASRRQSASPPPPPRAVAMSASAEIQLKKACTRDGASEEAPHEGLQRRGVSTLGVRAAAERAGVLRHAEVPPCRQRYQRYPP